MKLEMLGQLKMEQRMKLAPHMIQSMEILQLPILALQERIEQELNKNPVLEMVEDGAADEAEVQQQQPAEEAGEKDLVLDIDNNKVQDFQRLDGLDDGYKDFFNESEPIRARFISDETDKKLEALKNTEAPSQSLTDFLLDQWRMVEAEESVKKAGEMIINYINERGYLSVQLEQLHNKDQRQFCIEDLHNALELVQKLEPAGVGARDMKECLLIQIALKNEEDYHSAKDSQSSVKDMSFEFRLVAEHLDELLENRLPEIAKKMDCDMETLNYAIERMSKLDTSPGLQIGKVLNPVITPDVIVEETETPGQYNVSLADSNLPRIKVNKHYASMAKDNRVSEKTRQFLQDNMRSAQWIMDAIEQRKNTLLKVAQSVVKHQNDFFEKGQLHLKPLPMATVADEVGVHIATVSRAVSNKYIQCSHGILPLRKFFSGGRKDDSGKDRSWEAIRAVLQKIIDNEDKAKPLSDDQIREKLAEAGINKIARRTVAKYRKILNIPAARFRKKY